VTKHGLPRWDKEKLMKKVGLFALGVFLMAATQVEAVPTWDEAVNGLGDAGNLPGTAQVVTLPGFNQITGTINSNTDVDIFKFEITAPATFSATTTVSPGTQTDSQLFLFDASGMGIAANDDAGSGTRLSTLPAGNALYNALAPGLYYLAISSWNVDPISGGPESLIFPDTPYSAVHGPTGPGGGSAVNGWEGIGATGTYTITLTSVAAVPEPGSLLGDVLMFGPVLLGMVNIRRWRKK
jgi:hypothetical protein